MKKLNKLFIVIFIAVLLIGCSNTNQRKSKLSTDGQNKRIEEQKEFSSGKAVKEPFINAEKEENYIDPEGKVLQTRFREPKGYKRTIEPKDSFGNFVRNYSLKPDGSTVLLYNGQVKGNQNVHEAVFDMKLEEEDLQQCADSIMRLYAEYLYQKNAYHQINFHLVNGFAFDFDTWQQGKKLLVNGNNTAWGNGSENDSSQDSFKRYLHTLFAYASTLSMEKESASISLSDIMIGDIFIKGGSPGHVVMVADVCVNEDGEKAFLLAQGYMPAQEFHIINNPTDEINPWYFVSEVSNPFSTPEYTFVEGSLKRPSYLDGIAE